MNEKEMIEKGLKLYVNHLTATLFEVMATGNSDACTKIREKRKIAQDLLKKYVIEGTKPAGDPLDSLDNAVIKIDGDKIEITIVDGFEISPGDFRFAIFGGGDQKKSGESNSDALSRIIKRIHAEVAAVEGAE